MTAVPPVPRRRPWPEGPVVAALIAGLAAALFYLLQLTPGLGWYDSPELAGVAHTLGIAHPTGYPFWSLAGHLFGLLPGLPADPALRANALAALLGGATVGVLALVGWRLGGLLRLGPVPRSLRYVAALLPAVTFAGLPLFLAQALSAEVYTLHTLMSGLLLLVGLEGALAAEGIGGSLRPISNGLSGPGGDDGTGGRVLLLAYLAGLGLANHATLILYVPALVVLLLWWLRPENPIDPLPGSGQHRVAEMLPWLPVALLAGLSLYLLIPLRALHAPPFDWGGADNLRDLGRLLTAAEIRGRPGQYDPVSPLTIWVRLARGLGLPLLLLALAGWIWAGLRRNRLGLVALVWLLGPLLFLLLGLDLLEDALLPFHLLLTLGLGALMLLGSERLVAWIGPVRGGWTGIAVVVVLLGIGPVGGWLRQPSENALSRTWGPQAWLDGVTASAAGAAEPSPEAIARVFAEDNTTAFALWYQERVARHFPNVKGIYLLLAREEWYRRELTARIPGLNVPRMRRGVEDLPHSVAGQALVEANRGVAGVPVLVSPIVLPPAEEYGALVPQGLLLRCEPPGYRPTTSDLERHAAIQRRWAPAFQSEVPELDPASRDIWSSRHQLLGEAWARLGFSEAARIEYEAGIRINPRRVQTWYTYGEFLKAVGDWAAAEQVFRRGLELAPGDRLLGFEVVRALAQQGAYTAADSLLNPEVPAGIERWEYLQLRALVQSGLGRLGEAEEDLREAAGLAPASGSVQNDLGVLLLRLGQTRPAREAFLKATELEPDLAEGWANLGTLDLQARRLEEAGRELARAVEAGATDPQVRYALGLVGFQLGNLAAAQTVLRENLRLQPRHADSYLLLGLVLERMGDRSAARQTLELGRMSVPDDPRFAQQLRRLGAIPPG
jgi:tetratricopeptide (TPR) repeat protein